jgi:hypothetical protein
MKIDCEGSRIAACFPQVIKKRFPELLQMFSDLPNVRKSQGKQYSMPEIMMGGMSIFFFKEGSRNQLNNDRADDNFRNNYRRIFGMKLPHQDTVSDVLRDLPNDVLEEVKEQLMGSFFDQKWLRAYRLLNKYYLVSVDATGVVSFNKPHCEHCLTKTSKGGKTTYFHYVLEAKLVTRDGHAFSLATEWIENPMGDYDKQDCERNAFVRLAAKLKKKYPRLPVCILADGLYPYQNAFKICGENDWKFIFVLQDGSLKTVQEELTLTRRQKPQVTCYTAQKGCQITEEYRYETGIEYKEKYTLNWVQFIEIKASINSMAETTKQKITNFEYLTNIVLDRENVRTVGYAGRLRWKIENEGFNTQKNGGYELKHKYSRKSYNKLKNYYTLLQIAHAINQLIEKGKIITDILKLRGKETIKNLWTKLKSYMLSKEPVIIYVYLNNLIRHDPG